MNYLTQALNQLLPEGKGGLILSFLQGQGTGVDSGERSYQEMWNHYKVMTKY